MDYFEIAEKLSLETIVLPFHTQLSFEEIKQVKEALIECLKEINYGVN